MLLVCDVVVLNLVNIYAIARSPRVFSSEINGNVLRFLLQYCNNLVIFFAMIINLISAFQVQGS